MPTKESEREYWPSWRDVQEYMQHVADAHRRSVEVRIGQTLVKAGRSNLYFRISSYDRTTGLLYKDEIAEGHEWPADEWNTVPAMLIALLHKLDRKLVDRADLAERQRLFLVDGS